MITLSRIHPKSFSRHLFFFMGLLFLTLFLSACGDSSSSEPPPPTPPIVTPPAVLKNIIVTPVSTNIAQGLTQTFTAVGLYSDGSSSAITNVNWSTSASNLATIDANGLLTAKSAGTLTVTATQGNISASAPLTISAAALKVVSITAPLITIPKGLKEKLSATGLFTDESTQNLNNIIWSSSDSTVATVDPTGQFFAKGTGTVTIYASLNGMTSSVTITVSAAVLQSLKLQPPSTSVAAGLTQQFTVSGIYSDGTTLNLSNLTWSSSNTAIATVNTSGLVTTKIPGTSTISASINGITGSAPLTVTAAVLKSITLSPATNIPAGLTLQLTATGHYSDGTTQTLNNAQWTSSNTSGAIVSSTGLVTGLKVSTETISVALNGIQASVKIDILAAIPVSLQILGPDQTYLGLTRAYTLQAKMSDGTTLSNINVQTATWSSSNSAIAVYTGSGQFKSVAVGPFTISVTYHTVNSSKVVTVNPASLTELDVNLNDVNGGTSLNPNGSFGGVTSGLLVAKATLTNGTSSVVTLDNLTISDPSVISIDTSGHYQVLKQSGSALITGEYHGLKRTVALDASSLTYSYIQGPQTLAVAQRGYYSSITSYLGGDVYGYRYGNYEPNSTQMSNPIMSFHSSGQLNTEGTALSIGTTTAVANSIINSSITWYEYFTVIP
ncbi:Ig-like domain-containing protein [Aquirhabdus sp.]|uniref:Ig-like domain-containing protein n=1 Tax=Aquirhabdus sp. TaxID=2824160 RepID=UPI00396C6D40